MTNEEWLNSLSEKKKNEWLKAKHKNKKDLGRWFCGTDIKLLMTSVVPSNNHSGTKGVRWHKGTKRWYAEIKLFQRKIHLGSFKSYEDAVNARKSAEREIFDSVVEAYNTLNKYWSMTQKKPKNLADNYKEQNLFDVD